MSVIGKACRAAAGATMGIAASMAWAAAPVWIESETPAAETIAAPATIYELDTEMVVHNWVLCISRAVAEELVQAREESVEKARSAYEGLTAARQCGRFAELRVILQERLYKAEAEPGKDVRAFGALVLLADDWASAFVVTGSLPEQE